MLHKLQSVLNKKDYGIYRDDGLAVVKQKTRFGLDNMRKRFHEIFKEHGFSITIETGIMKTEFLDVVLDLHNDKFTPYRKPNTEILYISNNSNHPGHIRNELPRMIAKRISSISSDKNIFDAAIPAYQTVLKQTGYPECAMEYEQQKEQNNSSESKRNRNRPRKNIIYYNPPFCSSVVDNIAHRFLKLIKNTLEKPVRSTNF